MINIRKQFIVFKSKELENKNYFCRKKNFNIWFELLCEF